jgi:hypothetical protein
MHAARIVTTDAHRSIRSGGGGRVVLNPRRYLSRCVCVDLWWKEQQIARRFALPKGRPDGRDDSRRRRSGHEFPRRNDTRESDQTGAGDGNQVWLQSPSTSHTVFTFIVCLLSTPQMAETSRKITITISVHVIIQENKIATKKNKAMGCRTQPCAQSGYILA